MKKIKRADFIEVGYKIDGKKFIANYVIDKEIKGNISVKFPFSINKFPKTLHNHLAMSCATVLASLALPKKILLSFPVPQKNNFLKAIEILYDIRCYSEGIKFLDLPEICFEKNESNNNISIDLQEKNASLFWSGGVDSAYAYILLRKNGYDVNLIYSDINIDQVLAERKSVEILSKQLNVKTDFLHVDFPYLKKIGKKYSNKFSKFPFYNSIPFGRDIIHVFAGLFFNIKYESKYICFGHEYELWRNYIHKDGKIICRNDFQSEAGCVILNKMVKKISHQFHIFSPVAALSKFNIYGSLSKYSNIFENITSCYFSSKYKKCGKCNNCLMYDDLEKTIAGEEGNLRELKKLLSVKNTTEEETFGKMVYLHFFKIIQANKQNKKIKLMLKKKLGKFMGKTKKQTLKELKSINKVRLTPLNFKY